VCEVREEVGVKPTEIIEQARDVMTVERVFGEPYERNGITVIPAATISGGGGGGGGEGTAPDGSGSGSGSGAGFGLAAKPAGVYAIEGNQVRWQPALDVNRIILGGQIVAIVFLLVLRSILRRKH
jgi:uncharacterized spore protein YtfJ